MNYFSRKEEPRANRRGLTLIELSIVLLVLGILMGIVFYSLNQTGPKLTLAAMKVKIKADAVQLRFLVDGYEREIATLEDQASLRILILPNPDIPGSKPFTNADSVLDPWKNFYFIRKNEEGRTEICSLGRNGVEGGRGENADFCLGNRAEWPAWLRNKKRTPEE